MKLSVSTHSPLAQAIYSTATVAKMSAILVPWSPSLVSRARPVWRQLHLRYIHGYEYPFSSYAGVQKKLYSRLSKIFHVQNTQIVRLSIPMGYKSSGRLFTSILGSRDSIFMRFAMCALTL